MDFQYILHTLTLALPNLAMNGLDPSPTLLCFEPVPQSNSPDESDNYESYDPRLAEQLRLLYAEFEIQSTRVAELRRAAPGAGARQCVERLEEEFKTEKDLENFRRSKGEGVDVMPLDIGALERRHNMGRMWEIGSRGLVGSGKISTVLAKLERGGEAVEIFKAM